MKYTFSKMSVLAIVILIAGFLFTVRGLIIRYHLENVNTSYEKTEIRSGRYMECDITKDQLIGRYYSELNGTIKYSPYCVEDVYSSAQTYIVAVNEDMSYYVPLVIAREYQKDFKRMISGDASYHVFGKFEKADTILYYDAIADCTGIENQSKIDQMLSAKYQIKIVDLKDEQRELYKGFSLLAIGVLISFYSRKAAFSLHLSEKRDFSADIRNR